MRSFKNKMNRNRKKSTHGSEKPEAGCMNKQAERFNNFISLYRCRHNWQTVSSTANGILTFSKVAQFTNPPKPNEDMKIHPYESLNLCTQGSRLRNFLKSNAGTCSWSCRLEETFPRLSRYHYMCTGDGTHLSIKHQARNSGVMGTVNCHLQTKLTTESTHW